MSREGGSMGEKGNFKRYMYCCGRNLEKGTLDVGMVWRNLGGWKQMHPIWGAFLHPSSLFKLL